jgi:predicted ATPase
MLVNYRPEFRHQWSNRSYYIQVRLNPLPERGAEEMLTALLGDGGELNQLKHLIIHKTEGNPFFIEETVRALFEEGVLARNGSVSIVRPIAEIAIPATVQACSRHVSID